MAGKIILAEDCAFFVKSIDVPSALSDADARDFISAWIENSSPLPVEKIRFGFVRNGNIATIFAGAEERLYAGFESVELGATDFFVSPASLLLLGDFDDGAYFVKSGKSVARVEISGGCAKCFSACEISSDLSADIRSLRGISSDGERFLSLNSVTSNGKIKAEFSEFSEYEFVSSKDDSDSIVSCQILKKRLSLADVRDVEILKRMARERRKSEARALFVKSIPLVFLLLIVSQIFLWVKGSRRDSLADEYAKIAPIARSVEGESEKLAELKMFSEKRLHSISELAALSVARPDGVKFVRFEQTSPFDIRLRGSAKSAGSVYAFVGALKNLDSIKSVESQIEIARGEAKYTIILKLK